MTQPLTRTRLLLDSVLPIYDETVVEHLVVDAPPDVVYGVVRHLDLLEVHSPLMDAAMFVRAMPVRIGHWMRRQPAPPPPPAIRLGDLFDGGGEESFLGGWVPLGENPSQEIAFGAVGKVWQPEIEWLPVPSDEFSAFDEPGFAKIAAGFSLRAYGEARTLLSYEARTATTDAMSRERFRRYWWLVRPFVRVVMRAALRTAKDIAERRGAP